MRSVIIFSTLCLFIPAAALFSGCASVSVKNERVRQEREPSKGPQKIYVMDFDARSGVFEIEHQAPRSRETRAAVANASGLLAEETVKRLNKFVLPAARVRGDELPSSGWLLRGRFEHVSSGNVPLRILVGMGAGRSSMDTTVFLYDLSARNGSSAMKPFLTFTTTGGSGAMPGLITIPFTAPATLPVLVFNVSTKTYGETQHGVGEDVPRTARMITAAVSEYLARRGFIPAGSALKAKRDWTTSFDVPQNPLRN